MKLFFAILAVVLMVGCLPAQSPTNALRAAVVMTAEAVEETDKVCAAVGLQKKDVTLLRTCRDAYNIARPALITAQYYIDLGDEKSTEAALCTGVKALVSTVTVVVAAGGKMPALVTEAINFGGSLCPHA